MLDELIGAILQVIVFALIPLIVYLIYNKSLKGFLNYIGLKSSSKKANYLAILASLIFLVPMLILYLSNAEFKEILLDPSSVTGKFKAMGFSINSAVILIIIAVFKTSLAEEILFRGFVAKRFIQLLGFLKGNLLQAAIFGIIHTALFMMVTNNIFYLVFIFILPAAGAFISCYLNEKVANGSIIPGWISHGLANIGSYSIVGFLL